MLLNCRPQATQTTVTTQVVPQEKPATTIDNRINIAQILKDFKNTKDCSVPVLVKYLRAADVRATFDHNVPAEFLEGERK